MLVKSFASGFAPVMKELAPIIQRVADLFSVLAPVLLPIMEKGFANALGKVLDIVVGAVEMGVDVVEKFNTTAEKATGVTTSFGVVQKI